MDNSDIYFYKELSMGRVKAKVAIEILNNEINDLKRKLEIAELEEDTFNKKVIKNKIEIAKLKRRNSKLALNYADELINELLEKQQSKD